MTRVYLSGPITGLPEEEYTRSFARAEQHFMSVDLEALRSCTHIALLSGWENSKGAVREKAEAERLGLEVMQLGKN